MRYLLTILFLLMPGAALAAYPYDSVCEIFVGRGNRKTGGSGTIIAVSETQALVLSCKHVIHSPGRYVKAYWPNAVTRHKGKIVKGGFTSYGWSIKVGRTQDIAVFICLRPPGIDPVRVRLPRWNSGPFTNVGFPGVNKSLEWQQGKFVGLSSSEFTYQVRPVPGMSGGATFDRYGSLVGVIIRYSNRGLSRGTSSSGTEMIEFVNQFREKSGWQTGQSMLKYGSQ